MGNLLMWQESPSDSTWTKTQIWKATAEEGSYTLEETLDISDFTYYDQEGTSSHWYKIKFTNDEATESTTFSDPVQGDLRYLYTDPKDVLRIAGFTESTIPDSIPINTIYDWIYDVSRNLDTATKSVYGRTEEFEEIQSSRYLNTQQNMILDHKNVTDVAIYYRQNIAPDSSGEYNWTEKREGYDFQIFPKGRIKLFTWPAIQTPYNYRDIKITGTYGISTIPEEIEQLTKYITAVRIFVHITGGSYDDVTSWSLGEYSENLGEQHANLKAIMDIFEKKIKRLKEQFGISDKLINLRYG